MAQTRNLAAGITAITAAFFLSALTGLISKYLHGVSALIIVFFQYAVSLLVFLPLALKGGKSGLATQHWLLHTVRSLAGSLSQLLYFWSLASLNLLDASLLSNSSPLFIPLIVWVWLKKPVQRIVWISLAVGLVGVVLVIQPGPEMFHNPAALIALGAGVFSAVGLVATNKLAETEPAFRILAYNFGISALALLPVAIAVWKPLSLHALMLLVVLGLCFAATQWLIIIAYQFADATELSPFNYSVVIFSGLLGWAAFGTTPTWAAVVGTLLICAGGIASVKGGHREGLGHAVGNGHWVPKARKASA